MKNSIKLSIFLLLSLMLDACNRDELQDFKSVYLTASERSNTTVIAANNQGGEFAISVTSSQLVDKDVKVELSVDTSLIKKYNELTGKKFSPVPDGSYELESNSVIINQGTNVSNKINFRVLSIDQFKDGVTYVMPISIKNASGVSILEASKTIFVIVNKVIISSVASLTNNYFKVDFSKSSYKELTNITMEAKFMVNKFQSASPFISTLMGIEENFLIRFGDVTVPNSQMQVSGGLTALNVPGTLSPNTWYHVAAVYNGNTLNVYLNGSLVGSKPGVPRTIDLTDSYGGGFHFGYSLPGRPLDGYISQAKIWSKALSQSEIVNGMCGVDPKSPGLIGYWKFNESTGNVITDVSGNGFDAVSNRPITWLPNVRCN